MRPKTASAGLPGQVRFHHALIFLFCVSIFIVGCQKGDNGTPGADGATGPQGPAGPAGAKGARGDKGDSGTANVFYSDWFTPEQFVKDTVFDVWRFHKDISAPSITQEILDSGSVLVYGKMLLYNSNIWTVNQVSQLPIILTYKEGTLMTDTWSALTLPGVLRIQVVNDQNYYVNMASGNLFRYIVIPGGVKINAAAGERKQGATAVNAVGAPAATRQLASMTYEEVCAALHIPG